MIIRWTIFACIFFLTIPSHAQTLYQVEIIAFARDSAEADNEESWSKHPALHYPEKIIALQPEGNNAPTFQQLPNENLLLNNEATTLKNRRNMRVLAHFGWQQALEDSAHTTSVLITGGKVFGNHHELEGSIAVSIDHFLRADVNLWLNRFTNNGGDAITLPNVPGSIADGTSSNNFTTQTISLQEIRRMRSGELHYFDHPKLGLLMLVKPVAPIDAH